MSEIWENQVSHNSFCQQIFIEIDFKDNYRLEEESTMIFQKVLNQGNNPVRCIFKNIMACI